MKVLGIIAEYNPMHTGHLYHINEAKKITGCDLVLCIMSGSFTEQGNIAIQDKFTRAKNAVNNGIDLVIELPTPFAVSDCGNFASKAIQLLNNLNIVDTICFGAENDNLTLLNNIANVLVSKEKEIWLDIKEELKKGISFAKSRNNVLSKYLNNEEIEALNKSNNILAIEYLKELKLTNSKITPFVIKRKESNFNNNMLEGEYTSSTSIREHLLNGNDIKNLKSYLSTDVYSSLAASNLLFNKDIFQILKYKIITMETSQISEITGVTEGLENKIKKEIIVSFSYEDYIFKLKSKRYELSKIKRIMINILLGITKDKFKNYQNSSYNYAHVLGINHKNKDILSLISNKSSIPIITSFNSNIQKNDLTKNQSELLNLDIYSSNIHSLLNNQNINKDYTNLL